MTDHTPTPFAQSGLLQKSLVGDAYELVKNFERAVVSGAILSAYYQDENAIAAHLVAFTMPRMPADEIKKMFGPLVEQTVTKIRQIYDTAEKFPLRPGHSGIVHMSFVACAIYDLEKFYDEWKDKPLDTSVMLSYQKNDRMVIEHMRLEQYLRRVRRTYEDEILPNVEHIVSTFSPEMEKRFKRALGALDLKISTPEGVLQPQKPGNSFPRP